MYLGEFDDDADDDEEDDGERLFDVWENVG